VTIKHLITTLVISAIVGAAVWYYKPKTAEIHLPFPATTSAVNPETGLSCKALVGSTMYGGKNSSVNDITAELFKGTDKIAISVKDDKFKFLTKTSLEAGQTDSDERWDITRNDKESLIAVLETYNDPLPIKNSGNIFILNKKNGMAVWTKTRLTFLGSDIPEAYSYLLECR
jgi:hypothetical protein